MIFSATGGDVMHHAKPPDPGPEVSFRNKLMEGQEAFPEVGKTTAAQTAPFDAVRENPSSQIQQDTIPAMLVEENVGLADIVELVHGEWLVVTRKKRNKAKNPRSLKSKEKEKTENQPLDTRVKGDKHVTRNDVDKMSSHVDNVIKRGPGKRSRQVGKHATPTHVLLRNAGVRGVNKDGPISSKSQLFIQPGNFGALEPTLKKDMDVMPSSWDKDAKGMHDMELVPETQFTFDPGQTKFNPAAFTHG
ncbi:hypothetical protein RIF29_25710 [Crotalaria pallida]|uniref:Uncharacterized protein n=1 Tax=Crotalaria pallida TaxID=3830 RepID=A0AAN9HZG9_CROPI